jgi:hypothetical protein
MKAIIRALSFICVTGSLVTLGCTSAGTTPLCNGFRSYETVKEVRSRVGEEVVARAWKEESKSLGHPDSRPPYQFVLLTGPFSLSNVAGDLELTFYNNRLMSTEFSTKNGRDFLAVLREQHGNVPKVASEEVVSNGRTKLRYYIDKDGTFRFVWSDPKLDDEWRKWIAAHT